MRSFYSLARCLLVSLAICAGPMLVGDIAAAKALNNLKVRIPPAYTVCKGPDGGALILFYNQSLSNPKYLENKGYYNVVGKAEGDKRGMTYVGGDSGIYQHRSVFDVLLSVFTPDVKKKILKHCEFDDHYHEAFQPEIIYDEKNSYHARMGYTVGNGHGIRLKSGNVGTLPPIVPQAANMAPVPTDIDMHWPLAHWIYIPGTPASTHQAAVAQAATSQAPMAPALH